MPRRNYPKRLRRGQKSKRARQFRKEAVFAGLHPHTAHPSHIAWRPNRNADYVYKKIRRKDWKSETKTSDRP